MNKTKQFALLRIAFGFVWAFDAFWKWTPAFQNGFVDQVSSALQGQPAWIAAWIQWWVAIVSVSPHFFAIVVALLETAIAASLISGLYTRVTFIVGIIFSLLIWTIPEGFGGPYIAGSTDIGAAIIYVFVFIALWIGNSWRAYSVSSKRK